LTPHRTILAPIISYGSIAVMFRDIADHRHEFSSPCSLDPLDELDLDRAIAAVLIERWASEGLADRLAVMIEERFGGLET
jgi:hypothetical protein